MSLANWVKMSWHVRRMTPEGVTTRAIGSFGQRRDGSVAAFNAAMEAVRMEFESDSYLNTNARITVDIVIEPDR